MKTKYLIDTCIWLDVLDERIDRNGKSLFKPAIMLLLKILKENSQIVIIDTTIYELERYKSSEEIFGMLKPYEHILIRLKCNTKQLSEAKKISLERKVPKGDALHAIAARDNELILITRDKDFNLLKDICASYKPEEVIVNDINCT